MKTMPDNRKWWVLCLVLTAVLTLTGCDKRGEEVLAAVKNRDHKTLQALLEDGADVNASDKHGFTALIIAVQKGDLTSVKLLLKFNADVNRRSKSGFHPILSGARYHGGILKLLVEKGADINVVDSYGKSLLNLVSLHRELGIAKYLLDHGANVNLRDKKGDTALNVATREGIWNGIKFVQMLLEKGADPNIPNNSGWTPLTNVVYHQRGKPGFDKRGLELLIKHGADPKFGMYWAVGKSKLLLRKAILGENAGRVNAFVTSAGKGDLDGLKEYLRREGDINVTDENGFSALAMAARHRRLEAARFLIAKGADPLLKMEYGETVLHEAALGGATEIVKLILEQGVEVDLPNRDKDTPLMKAARGGNLETVRLLIDKGADVYATGRNGSATDQARKGRRRSKDREKIVELLKKATSLQ